MENLKKLLEELEGEQEKPQPGVWEKTNQNPTTVEDFIANNDGKPYIPPRRPKNPKKNK